MQQTQGLSTGSTPDSDEARLLGSIAAGDRAAFEKLYRVYFSRLTRFIGRMTRNAPLIEEIVNDTMLVVWQKAATFDGSCKPSTWIFAIAYRKTDLEQSMLLNLHKKNWTEGLKLKDWDHMKVSNEESIKVRPLLSPPSLY